MSADRRRVVFDCNILFQSLVSNTGPARRCTQLAEEGHVQLFVSEYVFAEVRDLASRPAVVRKFALDSGKVEAFIAAVVKHATYLAEVSDVYRHPVDPKDSHYVNLAVAAAASLIVSRDNHLLNLMDVTRPDGSEFRARFPDLRVITPVGLLQEIEQTRSAPRGA